jgi:hypothetical protein
MAALIALLAFIGGVIAVALKGWVDYALEERRERKAARAVARLMTSELGTARVYLWSVANARDEVGWWSKEPSPFLTPAWGEHRYVLAATAEPFDWRKIDRAYSGVARFELSWEKATRETGIGPALNDTERAWVEDGVKNIDSAIEALTKIETAPLPFDGLARGYHPVRALKRWRTRRRAQDKRE